MATPGVRRQKESRPICNLLERVSRHVRVFTLVPGVQERNDNVGHCNKQRNVLRMPKHVNWRHKLQLPRTPGPNHARNLLSPRLNNCYTPASVPISVICHSDSWKARIVRCPQLIVPRSGCSKVRLVLKSLVVTGLPKERLNVG